MAVAPAPTRNVAPGEGGPSGARLEVKVGAFYLLCLLTETEPRGLAGAVARRVKFQRGYEGHALDDIVVEATNLAGGALDLEIQAKRTLDFTASDAPFAKVVGQIVSATGEAAQRPIAVAIARTSTKIERAYQQLLVVARRMGSGAALRRALDAPRVVSAGMRDFADAFAAQLTAAGAEADDEALWRVLRRFQILVFDFESRGAVSTALALTLAGLALTPAARNRAADLWSALQEKALDFDADGGEIDRTELARWLHEERGFDLASSRNIVVARQRMADHSRAALDAIEDQVGGVPLDRSSRVDGLATALEAHRYVEIVGAPGVGKSALLKALVIEIQPEAVPLFLSPARIPPGGWLALSRDLGFQDSAQEFLAELAASGAAILFIDSLDRVTDAGARETVKDLLTAAVRTPGMRVVATVSPDFDTDQRRWLPAAALDLLGRGAVAVEALSDAEANALSQADPRLAQLLANAEAQPLTRNLYQLRQLLERSGTGALPLTEAALAQSWWAAGPALGRVQQRDRVRALRSLGAQAMNQADRLDIADIDSPVIEDLLRVDDLVELVAGAMAAFKHDVLRDWSVANLLHERTARIAQLPLQELAPVGLARALELYARMLIEADRTGEAWTALVTDLGAEGVHPSWLRQALLALVRSEQGVDVLEHAHARLTAGRGELLADLIRQTIAHDSTSAVDRLAAAGLPTELIPAGMRLPTGLSWMRLMAWLLGRVDEIQVPVGREILHFFSVWLSAYPGLELFKQTIAQRLYGWLAWLEDRTGDVAAPVNFAQLFAYDGRGGRGNGLTREVRGLFLLCCDQTPDLVAAYLATHTGGDHRYDVVEDVFKIGHASSKAAPAALAVFTIDALIEAEKRYRAKTHDRRQRRLEYHTGVFLHPAPDKGPFLGVLRADAAEGLRLVRRFVEYGLGLEGRDCGQMAGFTLDLPEGPFRVVAPGAYLVARSIGSTNVVTTALRALEAWGHEQVEAGRPVWEVVKEVLGETDAPAPLLAVAVDLLLSHLSAPDPLLIPFETSPELLHLDWERFNQDRMGLGQLEGADPPTIPGAASNASLRAHGSRQTSLSWDISGFLLSGDAETLEAVRDALRRGRDRLAQAEPAPEGDPPSTARTPLWQSEHALRMLDPANWRAVSVEGQNGEATTAYQYVEPAEEANVLEPLRAESNAGLAEMMLMASVTEAVLDPAKRTGDLLDRGLAWAKSKTWSDLAEEEADFERSQRWRAVVATATLVVSVSSNAEDMAWARSVLQRALDVDVPDRAHQVRHHALALAAIGWAALAAASDAGARAVLLRLAGADTQTLIDAIGGRFDVLAEADPRLPRALLRTGLAAAVHAERAYDDEALTLRRQEDRNQMLAERTAAEAAWLAGGEEPPWPDLPQARRFKKRRRRIRLPGPAGEVVAEEETAPTARPEMWFNDHSGGAWLWAVEGSAPVRASAWVADLVAAYGEFSDNAWGLGLVVDTDVGEFATRWLYPFDRLRLRVAADLSDEAFEAAVVTPLIDLPDESFLEASEELVCAIDELFWNEKRLSVERLVASRAKIVSRFRACRYWQYGREEISDSLSLDLSGPIQALFLHTRAPFGMGRCYLPTDAEAFAGVFPALVDLVRDAPGRSYVAHYALWLLERAQAWAPLDTVFSIAECWSDVRPQDIVFWRDKGFGRRLCALIDSQIERVRLAGPDLVARARHLVERLIAAGVPEALPLEQALATLRP